MFHIQLVWVGEIGAIASPMVLLSPSREESCTAQVLGAPEGPCYLYFFFIFLKTCATIAVPGKPAGVSAASREAPVLTAPARGFYPSDRVLLQDLMWV